MTSLAGKTAVILGASGTANFGSAIARRLAAEGANTVVAARRKDPLEELAGELGGIAVACDVTREGDIENLFATATQAYGSVDIAVFSAGIHAAAAIAELTVDDIRPSMDWFVGVCHRASRDRLRHQGGGGRVRRTESSF